MKCDWEDTGDKHKTLVMTAFRCRQCGIKLWAAKIEDVAGRDCGERLNKPTVLRQLWNVTESVARFVRKPGFAEQAEYEARLNTCDSCPLRRNSRCGACACFVAVKARLASEHCPKLYWPGDKPPG